jgi:homoserine acetyltransferase
MENKEEKKEEIKKIERTETSEEKKKQQKTVFILISALVLFLLAVLVFKFPPKNQDYLSIEEAEKMGEEFINENLMMPGTKATVTSIEEEYGLYKLSVDVGTEEEIESYIDKKGELFFPQSFDIDTYVDPYGGMDSVDMENIDIDSLEEATGTEATSTEE